MLKELKGKIQDKLYQNCLNDYQNALNEQKNPYYFWIQNMEDKNVEPKKEEYPEISWIQMEKCTKNFSLSQVQNEIVIFSSEKGRLAINAFDIIEDYFLTHPEADIVYADEDVMIESTGERLLPWLKPVWSPDTLFSFQYFGNIFAIRKSQFADIVWLKDEDYQKNIYDFLLKSTQRAATRQKIVHLEDILFHRLEEGNPVEIENRIFHTSNLWGTGKEYQPIREAALARQNLRADFIYDDTFHFCYPVYEVNKQEKVSIIIPSKDNLEVLKQCLFSIYQNTVYANYEVIIVDNGSSAQTRMSLEGLKKTYPFIYIYQPMDFNFSKMCNLGVEQASGEYILLLNDDMEIIDGLWLSKMVGQASLPHVGAVGAKLYYPNTKLIQHAGVYNTCSGPGHKMGKMSDADCYYYARNHLIYDLIGVTAACLLMKKSRYQQIGGLYEGLQVAYNDVDLCFRIYNMGWYCVQRNDVVLYHHESLSRGDDMKDEKKFRRLMAELDVLYSRHTSLYRKDPFLGTLMNSGTNEIDCRWMESFEFTKNRKPSEVIKGKKLPDKDKMNQSIYFSIDDCQKEEKDAVYTKLPPYYLLKGWMYIHNIDNARYEYTLILEDEKEDTWEIPVEKKHRKDVAAILPNETNIELAGFCCWFEEKILPKGKYRLWIKASDRCSRQRLYVDTDHFLQIKE